MRAKFSATDVDRLLGGLGAEFVVVEDGTTFLLRCELSLYVTEPAHPQSNDAIGDLADMLCGVFFQYLRGFHCGPKGLRLIATAAKLEAAGKKSPSGELGGLSWGF